mmetsp:Transcript_22284/g.48474  ORF Transcript_22284/g.48474 Transcript_22284/m.48474 type:complete len:146 (-) Transcript_22284:1266-1703(-)
MKRWQVKRNVNHRSHNIRTKSLKTKKAPITEAPGQENGNSESTCTANGETVPVEKDSPQKATKNHNNEDRSQVDIAAQNENTVRAVVANTAVDFVDSLLKPSNIPESGTTQKSGSPGTPILERTFLSDQENDILRQAILNNPKRA